MGVCTSTYYSYPFVPRRIRSSSCEPFLTSRWVNFVYSINLTPQPSADVSVAGQAGAWSTWDLPVTVSTQDVDDRGDDLMLVAMNDRIYRLDWTLYHDVFGWDTKTPIYRRLVIGPLPSNADATGDQGASYDPFQVKVFRRFTFEMNDAPADPLSKYRISVEEDGRTETRRQGVRTTQKRCDAKIALRGLSFLVTIEHQADEDFTPLWWRAEWDVKGPRIRPNTHTEA